LDIMKNAFATRAAEIPVGFVAVNFDDLDYGDSAVFLHPSGRQERVQVVSIWDKVGAGVCGKVLWALDQRVHIGGLGPHDRLIIPKDR